MMKESQKIKMTRLDFLPEGDYKGYRVGQYTRPDKVYTAGDLAVFEVSHKAGYHKIINFEEAKKQIPGFLQNEIGGEWALATSIKSGQGNTGLMYFVRSDKDQVNIPDDFKGIVIGRGGETIKRFSQTINRRISL